MRPKSESGRTFALSFLLDLLLLALMTVWMIAPQFKLKYSTHWASIESTFVADARFLSQHWPHPLWQPLWYGGVRFDYVYPPALRYGTAVISRLLHVIPVKAYHIYTGIFYVISILGVYLLIRIGSRSRGGAWLGALASLLLSPSLLFLPLIRHDQGMRNPVRLGVLTKYGEGPHMSALALVPIVLALAFLALQPRRRLALAGAAAAAALVALNNFYGATALAMFFPVLVWSLWITRRDHRVWLRAAALAALAYGLTAFWLVPSYFSITAANMRFVSEPGNAWSLAVFLAVVILFLWLSHRVAGGRPERAWPVFVIGSLIFFAVQVLGNIWFNFRITGEPSRWTPELDIVMILAAVEGLRLLWRRGVWLRAAAAILAAASFASAIPYVVHHAEFFPRDAEPERRVEFRMQDWVGRNLPGLRTMPTGSVRFWFDAWQDLPQLDGGSDQGIINNMVIPAQWEIMLGTDPDLAVQWLTSLGVDAIIVDDATSQEHYHDFQNPKKFAGVLPVLYDNHQGDVIYGVPRRYPGIVRVVDAARLESVQPFTARWEAPHLRAYAGLLEQGPAVPATLTWQSPDRFQVRAAFPPGSLLLVQESWDPAWQAWSAGRQLPVHKDPMGFMTVAPPPGVADVSFVFALPLENKAGRAITLLALAILAGLCYRGKDNHVTEPRP